MRDLPQLLARLEGASATERTTVESFYVSDDELAIRFTMAVERIADALEKLVVDLEDDFRTHPKAGK